MLHPLMVLTTQPLTRASSHLYAALQFDGTIQIVGLCASVIGTGCTVFALLEFYRARIHATGALRLIVDAHITGQIAVLFVQLGFLVINAAVLTLPTIPLAMYASQEEGPWVAAVILFRKLVRLAMITVLALASIHRVWSFHQIAARLNTSAQDGDVFYHRRSTDKIGA